jgi:hypothetical protein
MDLSLAVTNTVTGAQRLESVVRKYGASAISTYGSALAVGIATVIGTPVAAFAAIPAIVGMVSMVNMLEHNYKERELLDFYRDQIAAVKQTDPASVNVQDLRNFAAGKKEFEKFGANPLLGQELKNYRKERNLDISGHIVTAAIFAVLSITMLPAVSSFLPALGLGAASVLLFDQIDGMVGDAGRVLFANPEKTAQSDIKALQESLHRGDNITPLQVFSVLAKAVPEFRSRIREDYGTDFDNLYLSQKRNAMVHYADEMQVGNITKALQTGRMEAEDIALLLGNPAMLQNDVLQRLQQLHQKNAIEHESVMSGQNPPETPAIQHAVRVQARRAVAGEQPSLP